MKNLIYSISAMLAMVFFLVSCDDKDDMQSSANAKVNVYLIDAPAAYDEVWVEVLGVEFLPKGESEENGSAWITLGHEGEDKKLNLLSLVADNPFYFGEIEVPAGEISQIRLLLGDDNYIMDGEQRIDLTTPSAQQSGLKLKIDKPLEAGISYDLVIDFDASKSIVKAGNSGNYILKPVLRVIAEASATIEGTVLPLEAFPVQVSAIIGEDTVGTFTDENGMFTIRGLKTGSYALLVEPNELYQVKKVEGIETTVGEVTKPEPIQLDLVVVDTED
jgi:hypothetical protein